MAGAYRPPSVTGMHAVVGIWTLDESRREEQDRVLREEIVPRVARTPGFVSGYWTYDPESGRAHSLVVFDSEVAAAGFRAGVERASQAAARVGVTGDVSSTVDVLAHATAAGGDERGVR